MICVVLLIFVVPRGIAGAYLGKLIGNVTTFEHGFSGTVYAANDNTVVFMDMNYDGRGPAAYFWASSGGTGLNKDGDQLPDEKGGTEILKAYNKAQVQLTLPKKISEYSALGIFCKAFSADFGHVKIAADFVPPAELSLGKLQDKQKGTTAAEVILKDSGTIVLKGFKHDAQCPSAKFAAAPNPQPKVDELTYLTYGDQKKDTLEKIDNAEVTAELPKDRHWNEFVWFSVYCVDTKESNADMAIDKAQAESLPLRLAQSTANVPPANPPPANVPPANVPPANVPPANVPPHESTPAPNTGVVIRSVPALIALGLAAVVAGFAIRRRPGSVRRIKLS